MTIKKITVLILASMLVACQAQPPTSKQIAVGASARARAHEVAEKTTTSVAKSNAMGTNEDVVTTEFTPFVEPSMKIVTSQVGDLDADGKQDVILVLEQATASSDKLGEGAARSLVLLIRDKNGQLQKVKKNDKLVPCATCGGMAGDPFGYVRADKGEFTVLIEGGSRQRWSDEYTFKYTIDNQDWALSKATRAVNDTITGQSKLIELEPNDFGQVLFERFDPAVLPAVTI